jgi:hypothetical protein
MTPPPHTLKATALRLTWLKDSPAQAADCEHTTSVKEGETIELMYYSLDNQKNHHYFLTTARGARDGQRRWWGYAPHWRIEGTEKGNNPTESKGQNIQAPTPAPAPAPLVVPATPTAEKTHKIPGISTPIARSQPIYTGSNFTWGEALWGAATGDRIRMPESAAITENIVRLAKYMDLARRDLGNRPIEVTSWYRDSVTNKIVRGAQYSQHRYGLAIDFRVRGIAPVDTFIKMKSFKGGQLSLAVGDGFVHLDLRPGGPARWRYPGGPYVALW